MKVVIHPGMKKAGSTTIQTFFRTNAAGFAAVGVAQAHPRGTTKNLIPETITRVDKIIASGGDSRFSHVLISHESLLEINGSGLHELLNALEDRDCTVEVVMVLRPLEGWAISRAVQRLKSLRGGVQELMIPDVTVWFDAWLADDVQARLVRPTQFVDLASERGLLAEFAKKSQLPMPRKWTRLQVANVNLSPSGSDLALLAILDEALLLASAAGLSAASSAPGGISQLSGFISRLVNRGDHHRNPQSLDIDEEFRTDLLRYFLDVLSSQLLMSQELLGSRSHAELAALLQSARLLLADGQEAEALATEWQERFVSAVAASVPAAESKLRSWCDRTGNTEIAAIMLRD